MYMRKTGYILLLLLLAACGSGRQSSEKKIDEMDKKLAADFQVTLAADLSDAYETYLKQYPQSPKAKEYLFKLATLYVNLREGAKAISCFDKFMSQYPDDALTPHCLFTKALTYDTVLGDKTKAAETYRQFLEKYPSHELSDDAGNALLLLQNPLELIRSFEAANDSVKIQ